MALAIPKHMRRRGRFGLILATCLATMAVVAVAWADNVQNDVTPVGIPLTKIVTVTAGDTTGATVNYNITANSGDGQTGCNAADTSPATVTPNGMPANVSATPSSLTFTLCKNGAIENAQGVTYKATALAAPGDYPITVSVFDSGTGTYNTSPATFTLRVQAAPDTTAPSINCTVPDQSLWRASDVSVACTASDSSGLANADDASFSLSTNVADGTETASAPTNSRQVCDTHNNCATVGPYTFKIDRKAPSVSCPAADTSWHNSDQSVTCTATDGGSGPASQTVTLTTSVAAGTETDSANTDSQSVSDDVGNTATAGPVGPFKIDRKGPTISCSAPAPVFTLGQSPANVTGTATDNGSGPATQNVSAAADTSWVLGNPKSVALSATDNLGNVGSGSCSYSVIYNWTGFFQPVDNKDATGNYVLNKAKAGSTIPVKFSLGGDQGLTIFATGYPKVSATFTCGSDPTSDLIEEYSTATVSGLKYDPTAGQYIYNWKTDSKWASQCRSLLVQLADGTTHRADFNLFK